MAFITDEELKQIKKTGGIVPKKESFLGGLGRDIASPFVRGAELVGSAASLTGSAAKSLVQNKLGDKAGAKETMSNAIKKAEDRTTAKVNVFGREEAPITTNKQAIGAGLEVGANFIGGGGVKNVFQSGVKTGLKTLVKQGAKTGLGSGTMYGAGTALKEDGNLGDVVKSSLIGGATGLVGGAVLSPIIGVGEKIAYKATNTGIKAIQDVTGQISKKIKGTLTADDIEKELFNIENNYAKTRKINQYSKDAGAETRKRLVSADVLSDAVDHTGTIRTQGENGAKAQYKAKTIDGTENVVRNLLVREGESVNPIVLRGKMRDDIMKSGLEGKALQTALNNVDGEIEGLMLRATPDGKIPLEVIHDAKINTTNGIDYNTDPFVKTERKAIAKSYKEVVEQTSQEDIKSINAEIAKEMKVLNLLDALDGKKVKGGKLGKYFAQIGGNIVGGAVGSVGGVPGAAIGSMVGGEVAGKIKGQMLKNTFGQSIGSTIEKSGILVEASNKVKAPRLLLPAPKPGSPRSSLGSGPTINLPSKTQSTLDNAYSYNLGKRNTMYNTPNTTIKKPSVKLKPGLTIEDISNPKNFKTAEDYVKKEMFNPSSRYEWHLSDNPNLVEGKLMSEQIKPNNIGGRGFAGREENIGDVFSTKSPQWWYQQLAFENRGKAPKNVYLVEVQNPQKADIMEGLAQQSISKPNEIRIIKKAGGLNEIENPSLLDIVKQSQLISEWNKANGKTKVKTAPTKVKPSKK